MTENVYINVINNIKVVRFEKMSEIKKYDLKYPLAPPNETLMNAIKNLYLQW